ncbi:MAG TPA: hypothetical protein VFE46_01650 [Pirellulales bacterium]|jgi:hypothetical protein|nr:hypothetical protein [Pirellulales bacterium]
MNLILTLPPETEAKLKEQARTLGKAPEVVALEALNDRLANDVEQQPTLPPDQWRRQFNAWLGSLKSRNPNVDDSRDSIYPDR